MGRLLALAARIGADPRDDEEMRLRKVLLATFLLAFWPLPILWSLVYFVYGEPTAAAIPFGYDVIAVTSLAVLAATRRLGPARAINLALFIVLPFLLQLALGGFAASGAVVMWSVVAPFAALILGGVRAAGWWVGIFGVELVVVSVLDPRLSHSNALPGPLVTIFFALNIGALAAVAVTLMATFLGQKDLATRLLAAERERSESLLLNVLPRVIAPRLKAGESPIADGYDEATILFADIVGFTPLTQTLPPNEMVGLLDLVFSRFDELADRHGVEKIRTIGDNYMAVSGVPERRPDHAPAMARMALDMRRFLDELRARGEERIDFRIGIESGPCVGGVIGLRKFVFDIWGDPVNTASRMESHGVAGRIHVGETAYELLRSGFDLEPRGTIDIKGKGPMRTWFLVGERPGGAYR
jgi:class 3 adenylate cyclase